MNTDEIRARAEAATPGPWTVIDKGNSVPSYAVITIPFDGDKQQMICPNMSPKTANAEFISHAREDIPALLDEVERLKKEQAELLGFHERFGEIEAETILQLTARAEQAERERDAAIKCITDVETYLGLGSAKYIKRTIDEWRGAGGGE